MRLRLYLRQPLFVLPPPHDHAPPRAIVLEGSLQSPENIPGGSSGGYLIQVTGWFDEKGHEIKGTNRTLLVPGSKVDHALVLEG